MVKINIDKNNINIEFEGIGELMSLKHHLVIPISNVESVLTVDNLKTIDYLKLDAFKVGEYIPGHSAIGTFYQNKEKLFIDINQGKSGIVLKLRNNEYFEVVIELANYKEIAQEINKAISK